MPDNEFQFEAVGHVYAQALVNEALKQNNLPAITDDIRGIAQVVHDNPSFRQFAEAATLLPEEHEKGLKAIFAGRVEDLTFQVLLSMARRTRLMFLRGMVESFEHILAKLDHKIDVELTSAQPLSDAAIDRVRNAVNTSTGKLAQLTTTIDPALIGGIKLRIDDTLIDGSVATQLNQIRNQLKRAGVSDLESRVKTAIA